MIRVILFEDNSSLRKSLSAVLSNTDGVRFTGAFADTDYIALTDKEVLAGMVNGQIYKMIAADTGKSVNTVAWHVKNIYEKLHVNSAPEAVRRAIENKLV